MSGFRLFLLCCCVASIPKVTFWSMGHLDIHMPGSRNEEGWRRTYSFLERQLTEVAHTPSPSLQCCSEGSEVALSWGRGEATVDLIAEETGERKQQGMQKPCLRVGAQQWWLGVLRPGRVNRVVSWWLVDIEHSLMDLGIVEGRRWLSGPYGPGKVTVERIASAMGEEPVFLSHFLGQNEQSKGGWESPSNKWFWNSCQQWTVGYQNILSKMWKNGTLWHFIHTKCEKHFIPSCVSQASPEKQ